MDKLFDVRRGFLGRAGQCVVHHYRGLVGGHHEGEQLGQLLLREKWACLDGLVVVEDGLAAYAACDVVRPQGGEFLVYTLHLGAKSRVMHRERRRMDYDYLGECLRPAHLVFQQRGGALGLVLAAKPKVRGRRAVQEAGGDGGGNRQQHDPYGNCQPGSSGAQAGQSLGQCATSGVECRVCGIALLNLAEAPGVINRVGWVAVG